MNDLGGLFQDRLIPLETRLEEIMAAVAANAAMNPPPPPATPPPLDQTEVEHYFWGSHPDEVARTVPRKLPETFDLGLFTNMTILLVWQAWHFGIGTQRFPWKKVAFANDIPMHLVDLTRQRQGRGSGDVSKAKATYRQYFGNLRWLCLKLDTACHITDTDPLLWPS